MRMLVLSLRRLFVAERVTAERIARLLELGTISIEEHSFVLFGEESAE